VFSRHNVSIAMTITSGLSVGGSRRSFVNVATYVHNILGFTKTQKTHSEYVLVEYFFFFSNNLQDWGSGGYDIITPNQWRSVHASTVSTAYTSNQ